VYGTKHFGKNNAYISPTDYQVKYNKM